MKKILVGVALLGIAVLTFGAVGFVYAQTQTPPAPDYPYGPGMMGGYRGHGPGMMGFGYGWMGYGGHEGPMHESMITGLAKATGLSVEEIEKRHDAGETFSAIAAAEGLSEGEIREVMTSAHASALEEAVANGWLTPEQVDWMQEHMDWMWNGDGEYNGYGGHCGSWGRFNNNSGWRGMRY